MAKIDTKGTMEAKEPFICIICGETFQPPSRYIWLTGHFSEFEKKIMAGPACLICSRY